MKEYRYSGLTSGITLSDGAGILFWPGKTVPLPEEHDYMKILVVLKYLTPEPEDTKPVVTPAV